MSEKEGSRKKSNLSKESSEIEEIEIPLDEFSALVKEKTMLKILMRKKREKIEKEKEVKGGIESKEEQKEEIIEGKKKTKREKIKEELKLIDLKKEFKIKPEKKEKTVEKKERKEGILTKIKNIFKRKKKESEREKLRRLSLENLERVRKMEDKRKIIVGAATVLNDFLEIKFRIPRELTHNELAEELEKREIPNTVLKNEMLDFFKRMAVEEYTGRLDVEDPEEVLELVERAITELSKIKLTE